MWEIDVKIHGGRQLLDIKNVSVVPRKDEFIYVDNIVYKVISVMYDYNTKYISILVKEA
jgi:hypothetical protein